MRKITINITLAILTVLVMVGCVPAEQIVVYITPTPETSAANSLDLQTVRQQVTAVSTLDADLLIIPTSTPPPTRTPTEDGSPQPTVTFMGPIIDDNYTLPPSQTRRPTISPTPSETPGPGTPTETPAPTDTPAEVVPDGLTATITPRGTALPDLDTTDLGIQVYTFVEQGEWNNILNQVDDQLQFEWIKVQVAWDFYQPNGPDELSADFRRLEIFLGQARQMDQVNVLVSVAKAPDWARSDTTGSGPPDDPQALADFITLLLNESGNGVDAVEVWNEPNLAREWRGRPLTGAEYMRYFDAGYNAVKAHSPDMPVISAGLAPTGNSEFSRNDREFLREMYAAGLANYDSVGLGVHPYGWGNPPDARCCSPGGERAWDDQPQFFFLDTIEDYREIMVNNGDVDTQMWLTEFGWATWDGLPGQPIEPWMGYNDKWDQANYGLRAIQIAQSLDYVGPMFLWNLNFAQPIPIEQRQEQVAYSIVLPEGAPRERPLFWMLVDAVRPDENFDRYD